MLKLNAMHAHSTDQPARTSPKASDLHQTQQTIDAAIAELGAALNLRDGSTHAHSQRVISYSLALGRILDLSEAELLTLRRGVFLHDIGKIHVPSTILHKPGQLTELEWSIMRRHPVTGYKIVGSRLSLEEEGVAKIVLAHHEWYDGTGYPYGLEGEEIPLGARICSVVDMLDALTSDRSYRKPVSFAEACEQIRSERETHFDPLVVEAFLCITPAQWQALQGTASQSQPYLVPARSSTTNRSASSPRAPVF